MAKNIFWTGMLIVLALSMPVTAFSQEDRIVQMAIDLFKSQVRLPRGAEIKFLEKKESPIPDFYSIKSLSSFLKKRCLRWFMWIRREKKLSSAISSQRGRM